MSELTDQQCAAIVRASIQPDRILAGIDGHEGSRPDVLLTTVERIVADAVAAERARLLAKVEESDLAEVLCRSAHPTRWQYASLSHACDNCDLAAADARAFLRALVADLGGDQ